MKKNLWKNRTEQVNFAMHLSDILSKIFGPIFDVRNQGGGKVVNMVIDGRGKRPKNIREIKNYLAKNYQITPTDITKNHGHSNNTIVINISEISENSKLKIEKDFKAMIVDPMLVKRKAKITESEKMEDENLKSQPEVLEIEMTQNLKPEMEQFSLIKKGRTLISMFLTTFFRFEGVLHNNDKIFTFDEKRSNDCQTISFRNEADAEIGYKALIWYYGEANDLPILEKSEIMVNFFSLNLEKRRPSYVSFALSPIKGDDITLIKKRVNHVLTGYKPSSVKVLNDDSFSICYSRLATTQKFFDLVRGMGWEARMENGVIVSNFRTISSVDKVVVSETATASSVKKVEEPKSTTKFVAVKHLFTTDEALAKFEQLYKNDDLWGKVSTDNQFKVVNVLRSHYKNGSLELFTTYLVNEHPRPLWSEEERVLELNKIISNPAFMNLPQRLQEAVFAILKSRLGEVDPDALVSGLLELF